ncbi:MAG: acyl-CoA carboxylase subunit epsilon [Mycobacterium sp.]
MSRVSGTNAVSDGNETNHHSAVSDDIETPAAVQPHEPHAHEPRIQVLKGEPTDAELAALIAVLSSATGGGGEPAPPEHNRWGLPVDKLRYPVFSWQKITLLERIHMRR